MPQKKLNVHTYVYIHDIYEIYVDVDVCYTCDICTYVHTEKQRA